MAMTARGQAAASCEGPSARAAGASADRCLVAAEDAVKTASGLTYKQPNDRNDALQACSGESVLLRYTGWRQRTDETLFTTGTEGQDDRDRSSASSARFREVIPLLHTGEKLML